MQTWKIDPETNDLSFDGNGEIEQVAEADEETQAIRQLISTNESEWFLNTAFGLAYKYLQVKNPDTARIRAEITKTLEQEPRIKRLDSLDIQFDSPNRQLTIIFTANMASGNMISGSEVLRI